jgi:hypothetical protein
MNREWVEKKEVEQRRKISEMKQDILNKINACEIFTKEQKNELCQHVETYEKEPSCCATLELALNELMDYGDAISMEIMEYLEWSRDFINDIDINSYIMALQYRGYHHLLDSEPKEFDGDIIITDPCYIIKHRDETTRPQWSEYMKLSDYRGMSKKELEEIGYFEDYKRLDEAQRKWDEENPDDWDVCGCGDDMGAIGLKTWMTRSTIYGDWSCTTFNSDTKEPIGKFCADAGQVAVFDLNEVLAYNPDYDDHIEKPWCVTFIKNFKGTVRFIVERNESRYGEDFSVKVIGRGVNKATGEPLNFITSQTGL